MDHAANKWIEGDDENTLPFPSEKCPKCDGFGWGFKNSLIEDRYQFYCPECGYNLVDYFGSRDVFDFSESARYENNYTYPEILRDILTHYEIVDYPVLPLMSQPKTPIVSKFGDLWEEHGDKISNAWEEVNVEGQAFWPFDKEWMEKNRSSWTYFCPECGKNESVYVGPSEDNGWQIPEWEEDGSLVEKIIDLHSEYPGQDIDYCNSCNAVWLRPELDHTMIKGSGTYEDAKELLSGGGGWRGLPPAPKSMAEKYRTRSTESWTRGEWGKGAIVPQEDPSTGMIVEEPMTWNVTKEGTPHHEEVGGDYYQHPIWISPDGMFTSASWINTHGAPDIEEHYMHKKSFEPFVELGLTYMNPWDWVMEYWGPQGTSYGHAQNVLDILNKQGYYEIQI